MDDNNVGNNTTASTESEKEWSVLETESDAILTPVQFKRKSKLWKYFKRLHPISEKMAKCCICMEIKSYKTTIGNLKMHISRKHPHILEEDPSLKSCEKNEMLTGVRERPGISAIWRYFRKLKPIGEKKAQCNFCHNVFSYRSTITNLKTHLSTRHPSVVQKDENFASKKYFPYLKGKSRAPRNRLLQYYEIATDDEEHSPNIHQDNVEETVKLTSQIWQQFNHDDDEPTCNICRVMVTDSLEVMKTHLEENHPSVLDHIMATALEAASDEEHLLDDDENMYTEVIYLDDEQSHSLDTPETKTHLQSERNEKRRIKSKPERKISVSSDEVIVKLKKDEPKAQPNVIDGPKPEPDELDAFLNYLKVLLKKIPKESSSKLHLDIISLVMNATQENKRNVTAENVNSNLVNPDAFSTIIENKNVMFSQQNETDTNTSTENTPTVIT